MVTRREVQHRMNRCLSSGVPITNYGVIIAFMSGILERVIAPFREKQA